MQEQKLNKFTLNNIYSIYLFIQYSLFSVADVGCMKRKPDLYLGTWKSLSKDLFDMFDMVLLLRSVEGEEERQQVVIMAHTLSSLCLECSPFLPYLAGFL